MSTEETSWIYSQIFKEILYDIKEEDRANVKEFCKDLYINENTFDLIATQRQLIEEYDSLRVTTADSNPYVALGNLLLDKKDYDRAEHFYLKGLETEKDNGSSQMKILTQLSRVSVGKNQLDQARKYQAQANAIKEQHPT
ncbi:hypothetical protein I4U23_007942 [Adineta vaga]|nr:hypothetical protein I4U23_007942 [Adineta vaga]